MAEAGFWPLYEGKHIEQFLVDIKPIERWVSLEACEEKYGKPPDPRAKLVFRDIARNTDERTCIAAVLPEWSCAGNTLARIVSESVVPPIIAAVLNAFAVDFAIRLRTAATHLNFTYMARIATLEPSIVNLLPTVDTVTAAPSGAEHISEILEAWESVWLTNRAVAEAYGLTPEDFEYILSTFPVFARKRPEFYAYLKKRVAEWKEEVRASAYVQDQEYPVLQAADPPPEDEP